MSRAPPPLPPRTDSMIDLAVEEVVGSSPNVGTNTAQIGRKLIADQFPTHELITINSEKQESYISKSATLRSTYEVKILERKLRNSHVDVQEWPPPTTGRKKVAPPKPPRTDLMETGDVVVAGGRGIGDGGRGRASDEDGRVTKEELKRVVKRVSSIVDMNDHDLTRVAKSTTPVKQHRSAVSRSAHSPVSESAPGTGAPIPKPRLIRRRSNSSDAILRPSSIKKAYSNDPRMMRHANSKRKTRARVSNLIQMFELKSPEHRKEQVGTSKWTPPSPRERSNALSEVSSGESSESSPSHRSSKPYLPPKPPYSAPPVPPKPLPTTGEGPPIIPPRTPAPLVPPKPPGSKPPAIVPRTPRQRSHSDSESKLLEDDSPPRVPPK